MAIRLVMSRSANVFVRIVLTMPVLAADSVPVRLPGYLRFFATPPRRIAGRRAIFRRNRGTFPVWSLGERWGLSSDREGAYIALLWQTPPRRIRDRAGSGIALNKTTGVLVRAIVTLSTLLTLLVVPACGGNSATPVAPSPPASAITGTWVGTAADSSGSMMGAGMSSSAAAAMTWQLTQNGTAFSGTVQFPGYGAMGMSVSMSVSGTITGKTATFTMTMPAGSMMSGACSATATGSFDMDDLMDQMHGTYSGANTCSGPFNQGQMSMTRR